MIRRRRRRRRGSSHRCTTGSIGGMTGGMTTHVPEIVAESDDYKLLRDFSIQTGHETRGGGGGPNLVLSLTREARAVKL